MQSDPERYLRPCFAHTLPGRPSTEWEPLEDHLERVAALASEFAEVFHAAEWGKILGRCHDLGKYSEEFQRYIGRTADPDAGAGEGRAGRVDHSTFGARFVSEKVGRQRGKLLAFCIAGHHAGLPDASSGEESGQRGTLQFRLDPGRYAIPEVCHPEHSPDITNLGFPVSQNGNPGFQAAFFTRMLFSCLIDADRTATEEFCDPENARDRALSRPSLAALKCQLDRFLLEKQCGVESTPVNILRSQVLAHCRESADKSPGFFSLNVPTGGGKTYSSLVFALNHAQCWDLRRVIVAVPFTTITEQTCEAYHLALGPLAQRGLIEHHTNVDPRRETRANQMGTENWDAPLVVTTNVQFFESLFASATTPCRKLHRLAGSVIVLDEAQTIPVELLQPALAALNELVLNYRCSIVICTATQPALEERQDFELGLKEVRHIVPNPAALFQGLRRVKVEYVGQLSDDQLFERLASEDSVLCIVNTRAHAARLFDLLIKRFEDKSCFHLSTWMCGRHRQHKLKTIRKRLKLGLPCRVVSTQLIEAGVDIDFPAVYRAASGFDSIAQAAGRCNREGQLDMGRVYIFDGEVSPPGLLRDAAQTGKELMGSYPDPIAPDAITAYFRLFYWSQKHRWDKREVMQALKYDNGRLDLQFREASSRFQMISDNQEPILVAYDDASAAMQKRLLLNGVDYIPQRELQPYVVSVHPQLLKELQARNLIVEHESVECPALFVPVEMRQTGTRGAIYVTREEAHGGADCESATAS